MEKKRWETAKLYFFFFSRNFFTFEYELLFLCFQSSVPFWLHARPSILLRKSFKGTPTIVIFVSFFKRKNRNFASPFKEKPLTFIRFFFKIVHKLRKLVSIFVSAKATICNRTSLNSADTFKCHKQSWNKPFERSPHFHSTIKQYLFWKKVLCAKQLNFEKRNFHL